MSLLIDVGEALEMDPLFLINLILSGSSPASLDFLEEPLPLKQEYCVLSPNELKLAEYAYALLDQMMNIPTGAVFSGDDVGASLSTENQRITQLMLYLTGEVTASARQRSNHKEIVGHLILCTDGKAYDCFGMCYACSGDQTYDGNEH